MKDTPAEPMSPFEFSRSHDWNVPLSRPCLAQFLLMASYGLEGRHDISTAMADMYRIAKLDSEEEHTVGLVDAAT